MAYLRSDQSTLSAESSEDLPAVSHIIPDVLYPALANKMVDGSTALSAVTTGPNGSTVTSSKYGTVQSDGRMYYYTGIIGSKPIKDPRIGAHFGSQRHMFTSGQALEQETGMNDRLVHSIDGREWARVVGDTDFLYDLSGHSLRLGNTTGDYFEITGYFSAYNSLNRTGGNSRLYKISLDGTVAHATWNPNASVDSPLNGRYISSFAIKPVDLTAAGSSLSSDTTLGIHTIKIEWITSTEANNYTLGCEFIVQDTTSTATKSQIQIPSQNVVSVGKKFTVADTPHYDPFNGFTNDTTLFSSVVDIDTSLGLGTGTTWGAAWDKGSSNHIRPYNGGRVVKWVDSSGIIKTSVNMMPANAQNITTTAAAEITTPSATNVYLPAFSNDAIENSLTEVAKTYHWREFGNGAANGGTGAAWADASMLNTNDSFGYTMDDGLTSMGADDYYDGTEGLIRSAAGNDMFITFIGTGLTITGDDRPINVVAQNLPYGTHLFKIEMDDSQSHLGEWKIDSVVIKDDFSASAGYEIYNYGIKSDITIHQPKMPPIPEDAVILADYMLMADFVAQTAAGIDYISKGTRRTDCSRDIFYDETDGDSISLSFDSARAQFQLAASGTSDSDTSIKSRLPAFATNYVQRGYRSDQRVKLFVSDTDKDSSATRNDSPIYGSYAHLTSNETLGVQNWGANGAINQTFHLSSFDIATPTHTSHHYQTFETPFLHELVGGDRNMEQTNLVVTPDGKTWDEVTRDTSYIGKKVMEAAYAGGNGSVNGIDFDMWRGRRSGTPTDSMQFMQKDWAIAFDRYFCLKAGFYRIFFQAYDHNGGMNMYMRKNVAVSTDGKLNLRYSRNTTGDGAMQVEAIEYFDRGDFLQLGSDGGLMDGDTSTPRNSFSIERV